MKKKLLQAIGLFTAIMMLSGCTNLASGSGTVPTESSEVLPDTEITREAAESGSVNLTEGRNEGVVEDTEVPAEKFENLTNASVSLLYQTMLYETDKNKNILISPMSIQTALGMTELGAEGKTLEQMEKTVNGGISNEDLNLAMRKLAYDTQNSPDVDWNVANSLWFRNNGLAEVRENYLDEVVKNYNADVYYAPFDAQTVKDINGWVDNETHHMIPEIIGEIPDEAYMYLINAIAFEAEWQEQYEEDQVREDCIFENIDGSESKVNMLSSTEFGYFTLAGGQGFIKPYKGGEYSFVGILPKEGQTPEEYLKKLSSSKEDFSKTVREAGYEEVNVLLPEFTMDYDIELSEVYKEMGMDIPFDQNEAEFHKMMKTTSGDPYQVWIGKILHKTHIEVDRKGTKAAAVTAVEMDLAMSAMPMEEKYIRLDRPFVYAIVDNATGYPVFIGAQNSMQ